MRAVARNFFRRGLLCKLEVLQKETLNHAYVLPGKNCGGGSNAQTPPLATSMKQIFGTALSSLTSVILYYTILRKPRALTLIMAAS